MGFYFHRPEGFKGKGDRYLYNISRELKRYLLRAYQEFDNSTLVLPMAKTEILSSACVEFAEDLHNDIGIWRSYEQYNRALFDNTLPMTLDSGDKYEVAGVVINRPRIHHFLWIYYTILNPDMILSPDSKDLHRLTVGIVDFLQDKFIRLPKDSGVKKYLAQNDTYGWDVKKKLVWLGKHSYMFRHCFRNYVDDNNRKENITTLDDFLCQENTEWSGLGVIDILATTLDITASQCSELRSWYERHAACYRIVEVGNDIVSALNIINKNPYIIRTGDYSSLFTLHECIFGSLVPWNGEWYWSGEQQNYGNLPEERMQEIRNDFIQNIPNIIYRYCDDIERKARESTIHQYADFVQFHNGSDFIIYTDGLSMAAHEEKRYRFLFERRLKEKLSAFVKEHGLKGPKPRMSFPPNILNCNNGVAIFFNKEEGLELFINFNWVKDGLSKKGINLTEDEEVAICQFIFSHAISPKFVHRVVDEYGHESIGASFLLHSKDDKSCLYYLLRRYKGHFYRKRYPSLAFASESNQKN
ncbi:MAG: DUF3843 family protein [Candidatus Scalindua sp. AMX11]|nr:MAG: DUF3843 family protein [Candidatus Scalindua sp.]NOG85316.1 DUF3843 family protein [Planctomycetota bacterium]RZV81467.1 MAG: DUF3843 family protein [Candidatus Scalindua sp. SCAELEC01]TDE65460.1 MAG: DUF3843 family protein [Candidatus Scalindua sp. AMX11]GJQ59384.1 MAG: hypothetical protein SCALA701_21850 [Candidatus Scalindua sp.]